MKAPRALCDSCPLQNAPTSHGKLWGEGEPYAILVGEAPGPNEAREGEPFVGESGRVLRGTLQQLGLAEMPVWVTNTVLCYPTDATGHFRAPTLEERECCWPRLQAELETFGAAQSRVVALGATSLPNFGIRDKITAAQGRTYKRNGYMVTAVFHPAYVLRQYAMYPEFRDALWKGLTATKPDPTKPATKIEYITESNRALEVLRQMQDLADDYPIVVDLETSGFDPVTDKILLLALATKPREAYVFEGHLLYTDMVVLERLWDLARTHSNWIGHSLKFDIRFWKNQWGGAPPLTYDTLLAHYATDERRGTHDLKRLATRFFGAPNYEEKVFEYLPRKSSSYALVPRDVLATYAGYDVDYTYRLYQRMEKAFETDPTRGQLFQELLMPLARVVSECEIRGTRIDAHHLRRVGAQWSRELKTLVGSLKEQAGFDINPASPKQVQQVLYTQMGYPVQTSKKGTPTTDEEALTNLAEIQPSQFLTDLLRFRKLSKLKSTYVEALLEAAEHDGRVHTDFLVQGTITGRLASRNPNLLNIPRSNEPEGKLVKDAFIATKDMVLLQGDFKQAELRCLAFYSGDEVLGNIFRAHGADLHSVVARLMFGDNFTKEDRVAAKMVVFGLAYGRTAYSLSLQLKCSPQEAQAFIDRFFQNMPRTRDWQHAVVQEAARQGYLETIFGRRLRLGLVTYDSLKDRRNEIINFKIQSTAADITSTAMIRLHPMMKELGGHLLLSVHDSIIAEVPKAQRKRGLELLKGVMEETGTMVLQGLPMEVDMAYGTKWGSLTEVK